MTDSPTTHYSDLSPPPGEAPPQDASVLSINDIQNAIRVIDYAAEQGAFKGWNTIEQVLLVRNRMNEFLKAVTPPGESLAVETPNAAAPAPPAPVEATAVAA